MTIQEKYLISYKISYTLQPSSQSDKKITNDFFGSIKSSDMPTYQEAKRMLECAFDNLDITNIIILSICKVNCEIE